MINQRSSNDVLGEFLRYCQINVSDIFVPYLFRGKKRFKA
uniref:Uncharacterized protein n=1 Tax=Siphoviridae sp. ctpoI7 TaxID=2825678 RepID=A0A8S5PAF8_9CAUD|nr:MAG TPA: hypothetical protein [Siphoviridae sp. ctpoI7]